MLNLDGKKQNKITGKLFFFFTKTLSQFLYLCSLTLGTPDFSTLRLVSALSLNFAAPPRPNPPPLLFFLFSISSPHSNDTDLNCACRTSTLTVESLFHAALIWVRNARQHQAAPLRRLFSAPSGTVASYYSCGNLKEKKKKKGKKEAACLCRSAGCVRVIGT